ARVGPACPRVPLPWSRPIPLPFLWVNGRRDATISVMGANIYPEDIETVVYRDPTLVPSLHSFLLSTVDDERGVPRPMVALELADMAGVDDRWRATMADQARHGFTGLNIADRSSIAEFPDAMQPIVATYGLGEGPFAADAKRIKQRRIIRPTSRSPPHIARHVTFRRYLRPMQVMESAVAVIDARPDIEGLYRADGDRLWRAIYAFAG